MEPCLRHARILLPSLCISLSPFLSASGLRGSAAGRFVVVRLIARLEKVATALTGVDLTCGLPCCNGAASGQNRRERGARRQECDRGELSVKWVRHLSPPKKAFNGEGVKNAERRSWFFSKL